MFTDLNECAAVGLMALTIEREARGESLECKIAVAYSIENRVAHPGWWGNSILTVIGRKWQYSSMTAPGDPNLSYFPKDDDVSWAESLLAASYAYNHTGHNPAPGADSYFDMSIDPPKWAKPGMFVRQIGRVRFYNLDRDYEQEALKSV